MALLDKDDLERSEGGMVDLGTVLPRGSKFSGRLCFQELVCIDGEFDGEIISDGRLVVGEDATVNGTIEVKSAWVAGSIEGVVCVRQTLELMATATVRGSLKVGALVVEQGAVVEAEVQIADRE